MNVVAIDFETANERRDSACAVGLAWIEGGRVVRRESRLIRPPQMRFSPGNIRIHGILPADVRDAPTFPEAMAPFLPDLAGGLVLAHNAGFDMGVLAASLGAYGEPVPTLTGHCTLQIARRIFPDPAGCGLSKVAGRLGIRFEHHDAGEDAFACAEIALAAVRETGARDVPDLVRGLGLTPIRAINAPRRDLVRSTSARALRVAGVTPRSRRRIYASPCAAAPATATWWCSRRARADPICAAPARRAPIVAAAATSTRWSTGTSPT
ncbi:3'-5' exonuclease [Methylorubrum suomiense]